MLYLVMVCVIIALIVACHFISKSEEVPGSARFGFSVGKYVLGVMVLLSAAVVSTHSIPYGNAGLVQQFGGIVGQRGDGFQTTWPWQSIQLANVQTQGYKFDKLDSFSKETQSVFINATINFRVSPDQVQRLYRTVGPNYFNILIAPRVNQDFKDEIVKYISVDIAPNREVIRKNVRERLVKELSANSIAVEDLLIDDISFSDQFEHAIEAKQERTQQALAELAGVQVAHNKALQAVEAARGVGEAALASAQKQAEENRELSASITPLLVQSRMVEKLSPNVKVMMVPNNSGILMTPGMLGEK